MKSKTTKQALLKGIVNGVVGTAFAGSALFISAHTVQTVVEPLPNGGGSQVHDGGRPLAEGSPAWLIEKHNCWSGEAPKGAVAGHVVVTEDGAAAPIYGGAKITAQALAQLFSNEDHGFTVHAFCR